jgi:hypothetical protein
MPNDPIALREYFSDPSTGYPICGAGRVPAKYPFPYQSSKAASSYVPNLNPYFSSVTGQTYPYSIDDGGGMPRYLYADYPHCMCVGHSIPTGPAQPNTPIGNESSDMYNEISARTADGKPTGNTIPVAIAKDGVSDGRLGSVYGAGGSNNSVCGCPNVNEVFDASATGVNAPLCRPKMNVDSHVVFSNNFNPTADAWAVIDDGAEVKGSDGKIVSTISLPSGAAPYTSTESYHRGIWKCAGGYEYKSGTNKCEFDVASHPCANDSPVSAGVGGATPQARFENAVNKKLACCLNQYDSTDPTASGFLKYDCIDNSTKRYADFNALWTSTDEASDGGQMNAFILTNSAGKEITGFYTLDGRRCNEFSEFTSDTIQPGVVNPAMSLGQGKGAGGSKAADAFEARGSSLAKPSGSAYSFLYGKLGSDRNKAPTSTADRRRCPVLVRAALVVGCPQNPASASAFQKTYEETDASGNKKRRCSVASNMQVHVRVEQVWEIAGTPLLKPVDTVIDGRSAGSIAIDQIIMNKYGDQCPPGTQRRGDACVY